MAADLFAREPYSPEVHALIELGEPPEGEWAVYPGLTEAHIPELIRLLSDSTLLDADDDLPDVWAQLHAWRALGQLKAEAAIPALVTLLADAEDDWIADELPRVFCQIGPAALPALSTGLKSSAMGYPFVVQTLQQLAQAYPETRESVVTRLTQALAVDRDSDPMNTGFLIDALCTLGAQEAAPLIQAAFEAGQVDPAIMGEWPEAQVRLGLLGDSPAYQADLAERRNTWEARARAENDRILASLMNMVRMQQLGEINRKQQHVKTGKSKRKQALVKAARKRNRTKH